MMCVTRALIASPPVLVIGMLDPRPTFRDNEQMPGPVIIIVAPPRSGAGLLAAILEQSPDFTAGPLSKGHPIDEIKGFAIADREYESHRLTTADAADWGYAPESMVVEWSPRLGLRLGFLAATIPDARFIVMLRRPLPTISSLMRAWRVGRFATVADLPEWWGEPWAFGLTPGWRDLIGVPPAEVATRQWAAYVDAIFDDLEGIDPARWIGTTYERLVDDPDAEVDRITGWLGVGDITVPDPLPASIGTITAPDRSKWRSDSSEILAALPGVQQTVGRWESFRDSHAPEPADWDAAEGPEIRPEQQRTTMASAGTPFSSQHTATVPELLGLTNSTVVVTTYKSGHVIFLRRDEAGKLNTEFASYNRPMGVAVAGSRLSLGTGTGIVNFSNTPALAAALEPPNVNDAVYTTRSVISTGDVAMHEMAFAGEQLWFVNTRFSCLCTTDPNYSFVPRWRPPWISSLAAEDRCHLNGLALRDGRPRYVTALSQTDTPNGWRELKGTAGLIMDIATNTIIVDGLAMPHSPRWHDGRLWVLESGKGTLAHVDVDTGEVTTVATLPGFTRGLTFLGPYAVIGLSQVRESVFKDLPVTQTADERNCGVWVVDTRTGEIAGFVRFEGMVQEIFDVQALPGRHWPTILREPTDLTASSFVLPDEALRDVRSTPPVSVE
jgi:uncharacterized protein (TIGR03032 family)